MCVAVAVDEALRQMVDTVVGRDVSQAIDKCKVADPTLD